MVKIDQLTKLTKEERQFIREQLTARLSDLDFDIEMATNEKDVKKIEKLVQIKLKINDFIDKHMNPKFG